jgi:hypothetical protein
MRTKHICPAVSITIRGVDFPSNLILLDPKRYRHHTWQGLVKQVRQSHSVLQEGSEID